MALSRRSHGQMCPTVRAGQGYRSEGDANTPPFALPGFHSSLAPSASTPRRQNCIRRSCCGQHRLPFHCRSMGQGQEARHSLRPQKGRGGPRVTPEPLLKKNKNKKQMGSLPSWYRSLGDQPQISTRATIEVPFFGENYFWMTGLLSPKSSEKF